MCLIPGSVAFYRISLTFAWSASFSAHTDGSSRALVCPSHSLVLRLSLSFSSLLRVLCVCRNAHYGPCLSGETAIPPALLPTHTEVVASIPSIFQQIVSILQAVEMHVHNRVSVQKQNPNMQR
jgi:hypothetical protein